MDQLLNYRCKLALTVFIGKSFIKDAGGFGRIYRERDIAIRALIFVWAKATFASRSAHYIKIVI